MKRFYSSWAILRGHQHRVIGYECQRNPDWGWDFRWIWRGEVTFTVAWRNSKHIDGTSIQIKRL